MRKSEWLVCLAVTLALCLPVPSLAGDLAQVDLGSAAARWDVQGDFERMVLTVSLPNGEVVRREFKGGEPVVFELDAAAKDGSYGYELRGIPRIDASVRKELAAARKAGNEAAVIERLQEAGRLPREGAVQSGSFLVKDGAIVSREGEERPRGTAAAAGIGIITAEDQVIPDDLIVQGSACVGLDCVNNENFGFDTIRMKENNLRIHFDDTSTQAGFPANDWRLIANDSASGGSSKFSIEDSTSAKTPFTITAGASTNSIFVDSIGRLGLRTSTPVLDLHINTSNTPAIRLEQNNSGGFTAQTWDIGANEANFFVRDVTGGSLLSFRIRPGAPTSSIDISSDGDVGIGTASPAAKLHVPTGEVRLQGGSASTNGFSTHFAFDTGAGVRKNFIRGETTLADDGGNVSIGCDNPGSKLVIGAGVDASCATAPFSSINAGASTFTTSSSRTLKEHLSTVQDPNILDKIAKINVFTFDFINGPKERLGLMAEDFHQIFRRGSDKMINGGEVEMALWLAVQQLTANNQELTKRLAALEAQLAVTQK